MKNILKYFINPPLNEPKREIINDCERDKFISLEVSEQTGKSQSIVSIRGGEQLKDQSPETWADLANFLFWILVLW